MGLNLRLAYQARNGGSYLHAADQMPGSSLEESDYG